jgi:tyrosine-specific transport protein
MWRKVISGSLLVAGTTVGAGMLGIPLLTAESGLFPAIGITVLAWLIFLITGLLFLEATLWMPIGSNLLSMSKRFFGQKGRFFSGVMFLFLYYSLVVAYFSAGAPMVASRFGEVIGMKIEGMVSYALFGLIFGAIIALGAKWIDRINLILSVGLILSYLLLIGAGASEVSKENFIKFDFSSAVFALPVLFSAFGYHNIIPSLVTYFGKEKKALKLSIIIGSTIALVIYWIWQWLVIGIISLPDIQQMLAEGMPITSALKSGTVGQSMFVIGQIFAFFALVTSLLGVSLSMVDFLADGIRASRKGLSRFGLTFLVFFPPFVLVSIYPAAFDKALGIAGGIGEAILNGLIPIALFWVGRYKMGLKPEMEMRKPMLILVMLAIIAVMVIEVIQLLHVSG